MKTIPMEKCAALLILMGIACALPSCTHSSPNPRVTLGQFLTDKTEQEAIVLAILTYDMQNSSFLAQNHPKGDLYLSIGSSDPSLQFLQASLTLPWAVHPWTEHRDGKWGTGVYGFEMQSRAVAVAHLLATCGKNCGATETYTVEKRRGSWNVVSMATERVI